MAMTLEQIVNTLRRDAQKLDVSGTDFLAVQINLKDIEPGTFYVEVKNQRVSIEPYAYYDRNCAITMSSDNFMKLIEGKLDPVTAYTLGKLKIDGDLGKALEFSKLIRK